MRGLVHIHKKEFLELLPSFLHFVGSLCNFVRGTRKGLYNRQSVHGRAIRVISCSGNLTMEWKPVMGMLAFDLISAVLAALVKKVLEQGLNRLVLVTLRQLVATIFLAPIAFFKERSTRPKLTLEVMAYIFFSAVFGAALSQYAFFYGLQYTTATFAITFINLSPVVTFFIAVVLKMEPLKLKSMAGAAKIAGTLTSLAGLLLLTLYRGLPLTHLQAATALSPAAHHDHAAASDSRSWMLGTIALLFNCLFFSLWLLLQAKMTKKYPAIYSSTALMLFISTLQGGAVTLAMERRLSLWMLTSKLELVTVLYAGIVASGAGYLIMMWCVEKKGPVFTAAFIPIVQIMVATINFFFLHEQIYLGSVLGSVLMILGLYLVLWGKKRDEASVSCTTTTDKQVDEQADDKP